MRKIFGIIVLLIAVAMMTTNVSFAATDTTKPVITVDTASGSTVELGATVCVRVSDPQSKIVSASYDLSGISQKVVDAPNHDWIIKITNFNIAGKKYELVVTAVNEAGLKTEQTFIYYTKAIDATKPVVTANPASGSTLKLGSTVVISISDNESDITSVTYDCNGIAGSGKDNGKNWIIELTNFNIPGKRYEVVVTATNEAKLTRTTTLVYYTETLKVEEKDTTKPVIVANPSSGRTLKVGSIVTITVSDNESDITGVTYTCSIPGSGYGMGGTSVSAAGSKDNKTKTIEIDEFDLPGKRYEVKVTATNGVGLTQTVTFVYYTEKLEEKDTTKPVITADTPNGSTLKLGSTVTIRATETESNITSVAYDCSGIKGSGKGSGKDWIVPLTNFNIPGKKYEVVVTATNDANLTQTTTFVYYTEKLKVEEEKDTTKPVITTSLKEYSTIYIEDNQEVVITIFDPESMIASASYDLEGIYEKFDKAPNHTWKMYIKGFNRVKTFDLVIVARNEAGLEATETFTYYVKNKEVEKPKDNTDPTISVNPVTKSTVVGGKVVRATLRDDVELKKVEYYWKGDNAQTKTISGTYETVDMPAIDDREGTYYLYIKVTDANGNTAEGTYVYYVEDDDGDIPEVDADPSKGTLEFGDKITITADDDDGIDYVEYYWDDKDDKEKKYDDEFTVRVPSEAGKHYLYVRATDEKGNRCDYEKFTYTIEEDNYPGNPDIMGDINKNVKELRVEIRNGDDKIKFKPEEEILYYVDYYNGSSSNIKNAKIVVDLPTYLKGVEASDNGKISSTKITWTLGTLEKGEYGRLSFVAKYTSDKYNETIITVPAKIYSGSSLKDTSTVRNLIYSDDGKGTGGHEAYCIGYPSGTFRPNGNITRAELATMISNIEGITSTYRGGFTDVDNHWAKNNIQACLDRGYIKPLGYNTFGTEQYATRADLAYAIAAILDVEDLEPVFIHSSDLRYSDARCAMEQLLRLGIMDGYSDGTSKPDKNITRAEAVTIINNYLFRGELYTNGYKYSYNYENNYNYGGDNYILKFTDLTVTHWAYGHIMEATNGHRYVRCLDGNEEML